MTVPTREEVEADLRVPMGNAILDAYLHNGVAPLAMADAAMRVMWESGPLRARHVREAVEGLPTAFTDSREFVRVCGHVMPRAALRAALTGEGK